MHVHTYVPTLSHPAENLGDSVVRARALTVLALRHEFVWSFRGAQMPRSAALQMFEQKFRPFTILRYEQDDTRKRWEGEGRDGVGGVGGAICRKGGIWKAQEARPDEDDKGRDEIVCNKSWMGKLRRII